VDQPVGRVGQLGEALGVPQVAAVEEDRFGQALRVGEHAHVPTEEASRSGDDQLHALVNDTAAAAVPTNESVSGLSPAWPMV
jgi:hypothetical protein